MKKTLLNFTVAGLLLFSLQACGDMFKLDVVNPNEPTPEVLKSEEGMIRATRGIYKSFDLNPPAHFIWIAQVYHETMGDAIVVPWGNWQFRWIAQVDRILLSDGTTYNKPQGGSQPEEIERLNNRQLGSESAINQEWASMYYLNNQANLIIQSIADASFSGNAEEKAKGYRAWAYWWKAYAYSRIASMYEQGLIIDTYGVTNDQYKTRTEMMAEVNRIIEDEIIPNASGISQIADDVVPDLMVNKPTPASLVQAANTLRARNLLVSKYRADMTPQEWQQIRTWAQAGLTSNTNTIVMRSDDVTYPAFWSIFNAAWGWWGWHRVSERLIHDMKAGDNRLDYFFETPNTWGTSGRGIAYNSRFGVDEFYATETSTESYCLWYFVSHEENQLMLAEAELALGNTATAAGIIDAVRTQQSAGLAAIDPVNDDVVAELWSERRIGLFLRGLAWYDLRRWGYHRPIAQGGGRTGVPVVTGNDPGTGDAIVDMADMDYNFRAFWPVPDEEITFNRIPGSGGAGNTN